MPASLASSASLALSALLALAAPTSASPPARGEPKPTPVTADAGEPDSPPTTADAPTDPAQPSASRLSTPSPDDPLAVRQVVLGNGLTVLLSENHERPEVFGAVVVRTGGKNDPMHQTGMAHYLEHMLFKGTTDFGTLDWEAERPLQEELERLYDELATAKDDDARKAIQAKIATTVRKTYAYAVPNELDQILEEIGGTGVNAFTTYDETVYHNTFPASQIESWLSIYAHRFEEPVFRLFPTELEAVYEEKNIAIDTTGYELFRQFMRGAFPGHPYGQNDILGEIEHLKRPPLRAMKAYFERYYVPGNMALVLSGDFDSAAILPVIEAEFGRWKAGADPKPPRSEVQPFGEGERLRVRASPLRAGAIAFRTVPESHPDYAALQVARGLLSNEQRSGLIDRISDDGKVLFAVHIPADLADHNLDVVAYVPRLVTQTFRGAERLVLEQFRRVRDGEFDDATFAALKAGLITEQKALWEDNEERALAIGHAFVARGGWDGYVRYLEQLRGLTRADVERVAGELFGERHLVLRSRVGFPKKTRLDKPEYPPVEPPRGKHSVYFEALRARPKPAPRIELVDPDTDLRRKALRKDVTLTAAGNPFNDLYQLELRFGVGTDSIRELDVLAQYLQRIGTKTHSAEEFRQQLFSLSTTLEVEPTLDRFVVRLRGPQANMPKALELLAQLMEEPRAERRPLRQVRREIWGFRRIERKDAVNVGKALRDHVLYGEDSPYHREHGPWGARMLDPSDLMDAWARVQTRGVELHYVGQGKLEDVTAAVSERLPLPEEPRPLKPRIVYARNVPAETTVYFVSRRDAVQTQLWFAVEGDPVQRAEVPAANAFGEYFGGSMAGLVFQEIREFRALAYSAKGAYPLDPNVYQRGLLIGYVGCQADKTFEALDVMVGLITKMPRRPDRLAAVEGALVRSQETASPKFRDLPEAVGDWRARGYGEDPRRWLLPAYEELEFDDIERFYEAHVEGRPLSIMVVGDPRKLDPESLRKYGKLVRVREGALYSK